jgi:hypothetical protein
MEESAPKKTALEIIKTFSPATFAGLALLLLFAVFTQIETCVVRWWLMLPIAAAGCGLLESRRRSATGLEARVCAIGFWLLAAFLLLRDVGLSRKLAELFDKMKQFNDQMGQMGLELNRFFEGGR